MNTSTLFACVTLSIGTALAPMLASAQLTDVSQTGPTVPGGAIAKSLEQQIGAGRGDEHTAQSRSISSSAIRRGRSAGRQAFQRKFTAAQGLGPRVNATAAARSRRTRPWALDSLDSALAATAGLVARRRRRRRGHASRQSRCATPLRPWSRRDAG
jgi:hypothetical protein